MNLFEHRTAIWSGKGALDSVYRYRLGIVWNADKPALTFILMNPSTASETENDPTVARCCERARRQGYGGVIILNAFAFRATDPRVMLAANDPVGPLNDRVLFDNISMVAAAGWPVILGWGQNGAHRGRDKDIWALLYEAGVQPMCLKVAANGQPVHPLYIPYDADFIPWSPPT